MIIIQDACSPQASYLTDDNWFITVKSLTFSVFCNSTSTSMIIKMIVPLDIICSATNGHFMLLPHDQKERKYGSVNISFSEELLKEWNISLKTF